MKAPVPIQPAIKRSDRSWGPILQTPGMYFAFSIFISFLNWPLPSLPEKGGISNEKKRESCLTRVSAFEALNGQVGFLEPVLPHQGAQLHHVLVIQRLGPAGIRPMVVTGAHVRPAAGRR